MKLLGNLDCEARWAGVALPEAVLRRISLYAALFAACANDDVAGDRHEVWVPAAVDQTRLVEHPGWTQPTLHVLRAAAPASTAATPSAASDATAAGDATTTDATTASFDLAWADRAARDANDRSRALAIAGELGAALPGACVVGSLAELDDRIAQLAGQPWICKARWTAAGRDRARGTTGRLDGELRTRIGRMLTRLGPLVFEPWLDRVADLGICGEITPDGDAIVLAPHRQITDARGGFLGIALAPPVDRGLAEPLAEVARAAARRLAAQTGYRGRFAIDAFVYRDRAGRTQLHPLCEINARHSFGWIARALARRLGGDRLGFDDPPTGARVLIAPGDDRVTAWCA